MAGFQGGLVADPSAASTQRNLLGNKSRDSLALVRRRGLPALPGHKFLNGRLPSEAADFRVGRVNLATMSVLRAPVAATGRVPAASMLAQGGLSWASRSMWAKPGLASPSVGLLSFALEGGQRQRGSLSMAVRALLDKSHGGAGGGGDPSKGVTPGPKVGSTAIPAHNGGSAASAEPAMPVAPSGGSSSDSARAALERLFAQAQLYEKRAGDPDFATEEELESVVRQLEVDLGNVLEMLRSKEAALGQAEARLVEEKSEVEAARTVLVQREKQLEAVRVEQLGRQDELQAVRQGLTQQRQEVERTNGQLAGREKELAEQREELKRKSRELQLARVQLAEHKAVLADVEGLLAVKQRELGEALEDREQQRVELVSLQSILARQREEHAAVRGDLEAKRKRLEAVETDLSLRIKAFKAARSEIQNLKTQLQGLAGANRNSASELQHAQALLAEVQDELRASNSAVLKFQAEVAEQEAGAQRLEAEIARLGALLQSRERDLAASMSTRQKEAKELKAVQREYVAAQKKLQGLQQESEARQAELEEEREKVAAVTEELSSLKKQARQQSAELSDAQLSLQVKEAELLATRLEMQQLRSGLGAAQQALKQKTDEVQQAQSSVVALKSELVVVQRQLAEKEAQVLTLGAQLADKDQALSVLQRDADSSRLKLSEAEHALDQIAQLSRALAETAKQGLGQAESEGAASLARSLRYVSLESAQTVQEGLFSQANAELFATNSALLELDMKHHRLQDSLEEQAAAKRELRAELEAVQECLREKEMELEVMRGELLSKDGELKRLVRQWETREQEMGRMRDEVLEGAREIAAIQDKARASGLGRGWVLAAGGAAHAEGLLDSVHLGATGVHEEAAITKLELEVAKLEADSAIAALRALSDLSVELKGGCCNVEDDSCRRALVGSETHSSSEGPAVVQSVGTSQGQRAAEEKSNSAAVARMEEQLKEKDAALSMAKQAMENLAELTRRLVVEAAAAMNGSLAEGATQELADGMPSCS